MSFVRELNVVALKTHPDAAVLKQVASIAAKAKLDGKALDAESRQKMVELINGLEGNDTASRNKFVRCVQVKEQHAVPIEVSPD